MTAEIAIINKYAVALAADSAVTIANGGEQQKIYESADKLFELSFRDPVGIMVNDDMSFFETPLPVLIDRYRTELRDKPPLSRIEDYASGFLSFLHRFAVQSPGDIAKRHLMAHIRPIIDDVRRGIGASLSEFFSSEQAMDDEVRSPADLRLAIVNDELDRLENTLGQENQVSFLGEACLLLSETDHQLIDQTVRNRALILLTPDQAARLKNIIVTNINRAYASPVTTGVVIAGFGADEIFPTLVSFDLFGVIGGALRYGNYRVVDISRAVPDGEQAKAVSAAVLPFAQQEMVGRFLYEFDDETELFLADLTDIVLSRFRDILQAALPEGADHAVATGAEENISAWAKDIFTKLKQQSKNEIVEMVEHMPKAEMAKMAHALVNLTSIKRRVSKGMATVGGPIDVAVISKSEGFVWVEQKHYFPGHLNPSYFGRIGAESRIPVERKGI